MDTNNETTKGENSKTDSPGSTQEETSQNREKDSVPDSSLPGTHTLSKPALGFSMLAGFLSVVIGVFSSASSFMYIMEDINTTTNLDYNLARTGMIFCEVILAVTFLSLAGFFINNPDVREKTPMLIPFVGAARIFLLFILLATFWKKGYAGWYYILDPNGSNPERIILVGLGFLQGIFMLFGVKKKT